MSGRDATVVIVGAGQAGFQVAASLRELGHAQAAAGRVVERDQHVELVDRDAVSGEQRLVDRARCGRDEPDAAVPRPEFVLGQELVLRVAPFA